MSVTRVSSAMQDLTDDYAFSGTVSGAGNPGRGTIGGLTITNDGTDADHDIGIAVGFARDYTDAATLSLTGALIKRADATWAVGTNAGGMDSTDTIGNNTGYGVYLIRRSDTGVVDVLMSSDMTAAGSALTMPTNYDQKRLIGWVRTNGSANIMTFTQSGDYFKLLPALIAEFTDATITNQSWETATLTSPPLCVAHIYLYAANSSSTSDYMVLYVKTKGSGENAANSSEAYLTVQGVGDVDLIGKSGEILTNSASQIEYTAHEPNGTCTISLAVVGCHMLTRSNP